MFPYLISKSKVGSSLLRVELMRKGFASVTNGERNVRKMVRMRSLVAQTDSIGEEDNGSTNAPLRSPEKNWLQRLIERGV